MLKKGTKIYSVYNNKCPKCHEGDFFKYRFTYNPKKVTQIYENCSHCNLKYMIEPSFFYGAMYVGYAITVFTFVAVFILTKVLLNFELLNSFASILIITVLITPLNLRLSRILWINMFVAFDEERL